METIIEQMMESSVENMDEPGIEEFQEKLRPMTDEEIYASREEFKKHIKFHPSSGNPNHGTFQVNGNKIYVDMDIDSKTVTHPRFADTGYARQTVTLYNPSNLRSLAKTVSKSPEEYEKDTRPVVVLDKNFFRLPWNEQHAVFMHEVGHAVMQGKDGSNKALEQRAKAKDAYKGPTKGIHGNPMDEIEADRFAANRSNKLMTGLNDYAKANKKTLLDQSINIFKKGPEELLDSLLADLNQTYALYQNAIAYPSLDTSMGLAIALGYGVGKIPTGLTMSQLRDRIEYVKSHPTLMSKINYGLRGLMNYGTVSVTSAKDLHQRKKALKDKSMTDADVYKRGYKEAAITEAASRQIKNEEVRDGHLSDLPESLRATVMEVHKLIVTTARNEFSKNKYDYLNTQKWAKEWLDQFLTEPMNNTAAGSVRLYKKGKRFRCMIQMTEHVENTRNTEDEEFFHGFIRNVHTSVRAKVRRKYDLTLTCESEHGEPFEGFDVWTKQKTAKELWESFEDKKIKQIKESADNIEYMMLGMNELPYGLQESINEAYSLISRAFSDDSYKENGYALLRRDVDGFVEGSIVITPELDEIDENTNSIYESVWENVHTVFENNNPTKTLNLHSDGSTYFEIGLDQTYAGMLWDYLEDHIDYTDTLMVKESYPDSDDYIVWDPYSESGDNNAKTNQSEATKTLRTLSQQIINAKGNKVTQYTANTYAIVITKNLLPTWTRGHNKLTIKLKSKSENPTLEFNIPEMTQDFVSRFVNGRETINGLLHRTPEIKITMSPEIFNTMKDPDDAFNFFKAAIKYYDSGINVYTGKIMNALNSVNKDIKHLISTTKLSGLVTMPIQMLLVFNNVDMSSKDVFKISNEDIKTVTRFIMGIGNKYKSPAEEKSRILSDLSKIVHELKESCEYGYNLKTCVQLVEGVTDLYNGKFDDAMKESKQRLYDEAIDKDWTYRSNDAQTVYVQEKFGVKKLKKFPSNLVAYITIETEAIMTYDEKQMLSSYCLSKIDLVEWYIELIDSQSKKYIVPHSRPYLVTLHEQLLKCYKNIMAVDVEARQRKRKQATSQYTGPSGMPKGYEG